MKAWWRRQEVEVPKREPRRFYIPEDKIEEYFALSDADDREKCRITRYKLWMFVASMFPEVREGRWILGSETILRPYVEERIGE
jgi:hypothetical protein